MVAFIDLPKVAWVRTTAVTTVHSGSGTLSKCEKAKPDSAAIVTLRDRPSCALCSGNCERNDAHWVARLFITNSVRQCPTRTDLRPSAFCRFHATVQNTFKVERRLMPMRLSGPAQMRPVRTAAMASRRGGEKRAVPGQRLR